MTCTHCSDPDYPCDKELRGWEYQARTRLIRLRHAWPEPTRTPEQRERIRTAFAYHALMARVLTGELGPLKREQLKDLIVVLAG